MDPGTILSVVELSTSVLRLGYKVHREFFGQDKSIDKLKQLNGRLQTLNVSLEDISQDAKSTTRETFETFKGIDMLVKTLEECKEFLSQYEKALSQSGFRATAQRARFITGQSETRLDAFHKRIDQHYLELQHWNSRILVRKFQNLQDDIIRTRSSASMLPTAGSDQVRSQNISNVSPDIGPTRTMTGDTMIDGLTFTNPLSTSPRASRSPALRPLSRTPSLASISELPDAIMGESGQLFDTPTHRPSVGLSSSMPIMNILSQNHHTSVHHWAFSQPPSIAESSDDVSTTSENQPTSSALAPSGSSPSSQGRAMTLVLGQRRWSFNAGSCNIHDEDGTRIVEWSNQSTKINHFLPAGTSRIPHTKPNDAKFEVSFIPKGAKRSVEVIENNTSKHIPATPRYLFSYKADRETFQRRLRGRKYLEMVQAKIIHSETDKYIAKDVHLKVWCRDELDEEPTLSFSHHQEGQSNHHVEYKIRWFKRTAETKGDHRLILRVYSQETDLEYGPKSEEGGRRASTFGNMIRRKSGSSSQSRSPSVSPLLPTLYDTKGIIPPPSVQALGYLDIEFQSSKLRENFVNACHEAHHPGSRSSRRSTAISDGLPSPQLASRPPSWSLPPVQNTNEGVIGLQGTSSSAAQRYSPTDFRNAFAQYTLEQPSSGVPSQLATSPFSQSTRIPSHSPEPP